MNVHVTCHCPMYLCVFFWYLYVSRGVVFRAYSPYISCPGPVTSPFGVSAELVVTCLPGPVLSAFSFPLRKLHYFCVLLQSNATGLKAEMEGLPHYVYCHNVILSYCSLVILPISSKTEFHLMKLGRGLIPFL